MAKQVMLTTVNNPYNPFEEYRKWLMFDINNGSHCGEWLARLTPDRDDLSEAEYDEAIEKAIDIIVLSDPTGQYTKIAKGETPKTN